MSNEAAKSESLGLKKYFWREKNADKFIGKCKVIKPTKAELEKEISAKLTQKVEKIVYIFDRNKRNTFLANKGKPSEFVFSGKSEEEIKQILAQNIIVDLLQLAMDASEFYKLDYKDINEFSDEIWSDEQTICNKLNAAISSLSQNPEIEIQSIQRAAVSLAYLVHVQLDEVEKLRTKKEREQGNFFNGKYVFK